MQIADLDHDDHRPPSAHEARPARRLALVPPAPARRTCTAAEALALVLDPRPVVAALHVLLAPALLAAWWGVVRAGAGLLVRLDDGAGVPSAGAAQLNNAALVELLAAEAPELSTELDPAALERLTDPAHPDARPWVVLDGPALGRMLVQRDPLRRLMAAAARLGTPDGARPRAWVADVDLARAERPSAPRTDARTLVVDGGDWVALLACVADGPEDDATTIRCDGAALDEAREVTGAAPVLLPAGWP